MLESGNRSAPWPDPRAIIGRALLATRLCKSWSSVPMPLPELFSGAGGGRLQQWIAAKTSKPQSSRDSGRTKNVPGTVVSAVGSTGIFAVRRGAEGSFML